MAPLITPDRRGERFTNMKRVRPWPHGEIELYVGPSPVFLDLQDFKQAAAKHAWCGSGMQIRVILYLVIPRCWRTECPAATQPLPKRAAD